MEWQQELMIVARVAVAMLLGGLVGAEREFADKPAGFRTHMLVAGAAALFVDLGEVMVRGFDGDPDQVRADPIRIIEAVITGISFIGAGTILHRARRGDGVQGLTTAASLLVSASVGLATALGAYIVAATVAVLAVVVLRTLKIIERGLLGHDGDSKR